MATVNDHTLFVNQPSVLSSRQIVARRVDSVEENFKGAFTALPKIMKESSDCMLMPLSDAIAEFQ